MAEHSRSAADRTVSLPVRIRPHGRWLGLGLSLGVSLLVLEPPLRAEVRGAAGAKSLGTLVNGSRDGACGAGLCEVSGGTAAGRNLFHRFETFDTRGAITGVRIQSDGYRNVMVGVLSPLGTFIDKGVALSSKGNLFWLSPGGIAISGAGGFQNVQHLQLSTATGLRFGAGLFDALTSTAEQAALLVDEPQRGPAGLVTDPAGLSALGLQANGDLSLADGALTVEESLLLDSQGGNVLLQAAQVLLPGGAVELSGRGISATGSTVDVSSSTGVGGRALFSGETVSLNQSTVNASGALGGGAVSISAVAGLTLQQSDLLARGGQGSLALTLPQAAAADPAPVDPQTQAQPAPQPAPVVAADQPVVAPAVDPTSAAPVDSAVVPTAPSAPADPSAPAPADAASAAQPPSAQAPQPAPSAPAESRANGGTIALLGQQIQQVGGVIDASGESSLGQVQQQGGIAGLWTYQLGTSPTSAIPPVADSAVPAAAIAPVPATTVAVGAGSGTGQGGSITISGADVRQAGTINANGSSGGRISVTAQNAIEAAGSLLAQGLQSNGGAIQLQSGQQTSLLPGALLDVSGASAGGSVAVNGGGSLTISSAEVRALGLADQGVGGTLELTAGNVQLNAARVDASGNAGGGEVLMGGGEQGAALPSGAPLAQRVHVDASSVLQADAWVNGDGGRVITYGSDALSMDGSLFARGGTQSGDGGFVETSAPLVDFGRNLNIATSAIGGQAGDWLIDPTEFSIVTGSGGSIQGNQIGADALAALLAGGSGSSNILIETSAGGEGQPGDIFVNAPLSWNGPGSLSLSAASKIWLRANISSTGIGSGGLTLTAPQGILVEPAGSTLAISTVGDQLYRGDITITQNKSLQLSTTPQGAGGIAFFGGVTGDGGLSIDLYSSSGRVVFNPLSENSAYSVGAIDVGRQSALGRTYINADISASRGLYFGNDVYVAVKGVGSFVNGGFNDAFVSTSGSSSGSEYAAQGATKLSSLIPGWDVYLSPLVFGAGSSDAAGVIDGVAVPRDLRNLLDIASGANSYVGQGNAITLANSGCYDNCGGYYTFTVSQDAAFKSEGVSSLRMSSSGNCNAGYCIVNGPYVVSQGTVFLSAGDTVSFNWSAAGGSDDYSVNAFLMDPVGGSILPLLNSTGGSVPSAWSTSAVDGVVSAYNSSANASGVWSAAVNGWITSTVTVPQGFGSGNYKFVYVSGTYDGSGGRAVGASMNVDSIMVSGQQPLNLFSDAVLPSSVTLSSSLPDSTAVFAGNVENRASSGLTISAPSAVQIVSLSGVGGLTASASHIAIAGDQLGSSALPLSLSGATTIDLSAVGSIYARHIGNVSGLRAQSSQGGRVDIDVAGNLSLDVSWSSLVRSPGGTVVLRASGAYQQNSVVVDASDAFSGAAGGQIYINASTVNIQGVSGGLGTYSLNTSGVTSGGSIQIGSSSVPGYLAEQLIRPSSVTLNGVSFNADPPAAGGSIGVQSTVAISVANANFNVTGATGGSISLSTPGLLAVQDVTMVGGPAASFAVVSPSQSITGLVQSLNGLEPAPLPPTTSPPSSASADQSVASSATTTTATTTPTPDASGGTTTTAPPADTSSSTTPSADNQTPATTADTTPATTEQVIQVLAQNTEPQVVNQALSTQQADPVATTATTTVTADPSVPQQPAVQASLETVSSFELVGDLAPVVEGLTQVLLDGADVAVLSAFIATQIAPADPVVASLFQGLVFELADSLGLDMGDGLNGAVVIQADSSNGSASADPVSAMLGSAKEADAEQAVASSSGASAESTSSGSADSSSVSVTQRSSQETAQSFSNGEQKSSQEAAAKLGLGASAGQVTVPTPQQLQGALLKIQQFVRAQQTSAKP